MHVGDYGWERRCQYVGGLCSRSRPVIGGLLAATTTIVELSQPSCLTHGRLAKTQEETLKDREVFCALP